MYQEEVIYDDSPFAEYFNSINENFEFTTVDTDRESIDEKKKKQRGRISNYCYKISSQCKITAQNIYETLMGENSSGLVDLEEMSLLMEPFLKYLAKLMTRSQFEDIMMKKISAMPRSTRKLITFTSRVDGIPIFSDKTKYPKTLALWLAIPTIVIKKMNKHLPEIPIISGNIDTILSIYYTLFLFLFMRSTIHKYYQSTVINNILHFTREYVKLDHVASKCIRHIQEVELVSRGYKLSNNIAPITRLEKSMPRDELQCLHLREMVLETIKVIDIEENVRLLALRQLYQTQMMAFQQQLLQQMSLNSDSMDGNAMDEYQFASMNYTPSIPNPIGTNDSYSKYTQYPNKSIISDDETYRPHNSIMKSEILPITNNSHSQSSIISGQYHMLKFYSKQHYHYFRTYIVKKFINNKLGFLNKKKTNKKTTLTKILSSISIISSKIKNQQQDEQKYIIDNPKNNEDGVSSSSKYEDKNNKQTTSSNIPMEIDDDLTNEIRMFEEKEESSIPYYNPMTEKYKSLNDLLAKKYDPESVHDDVQEDNDENVNTLQQGKETNSKENQEKSKDHILQESLLEKRVRIKETINQNQIENDQVQDILKAHHQNEIVIYEDQPTSMNESICLSTQEEIRKEIYGEFQNEPGVSNSEERGGNSSDNEEDDQEIEISRAPINFKNLALQLDALLAKNEMVGKTFQEKNENNIEGKNENEKNVNDIVIEDKEGNSHENKNENEKNVHDIIIEDKEDNKEEDKSGLKEKHNEQEIIFGKDTKDDDVKRNKNNKENLVGEEKCNIKDAIDKKNEALQENEDFLKKELFNKDNQKQDHELLLTNNENKDNQKQEHELLLTNNENKDSQKQDNELLLTNNENKDIMDSDIEEEPEEKLFDEEEIDHSRNNDNQYSHNNNKDDIDINAVRISSFGFPIAETVTVSPFMDLQSQVFSNELLKGQIINDDLGNKLKVEDNHIIGDNNHNSLANELTKALSFSNGLDNGTSSGFLQGDDQAYFTQLNNHLSYYQTQSLSNDYDWEEDQDQEREQEYEIMKKENNSINIPIGNEKIESSININKTLEANEINNQEKEAIPNSSQSTEQSFNQHPTTITSSISDPATVEPTLPTSMSKRDQLMLDHLKSQLARSREACYHFGIFLLLAYQYHPLSKRRHVSYWLKLNDALTTWTHELQGWYKKMEGQLSQNNVVTLNSIDDGNIIDEEEKETMGRMDHDARILCQKLRYMNMVMQEVQIQLSFFYDEFVNHTNTIASHTMTNEFGSKPLNENDILLIEQEEKMKEELQRKYSQLWQSIQGLQREFEDTQYVMKAVFDNHQGEGDAWKTLKERQRQLEYERQQAQLLKQKQDREKDASSDPSIRIFEENTIIDMDTEERVYEAVVGANEPEQRRPHSKLTRAERIIIQKQKREEEKKRREKLNQTLSMMSELKTVLTEREKSVKENVRHQIQINLPQ